MAVHFGWVLQYLYVLHLHKSTVTSEIFSFYYNISKICSFSKQGHITLSNALYNATLHLYSVWRGSPGSHWQVCGMKGHPRASWSLPRSVLESGAAALCPGLAWCPWWQHLQRQPQTFSSGPRVLHSPVLTALVNLLHLPNDLLFKDGQDGVILPHLLKDHTTVELIAHFLEVIPETNRNMEGREGKKKQVNGQRGS